MSVFLNKATPFPHLQRISRSSWVVYIFILMYSAHWRCAARATPCCWEIIDYGCIDHADSSRFGVDGAHTGWWLVKVPSSPACVSKQGPIRELPDLHAISRLHRLLGKRPLVMDPENLESPASNSTPSVGFDGGYRAWTLCSANCTEEFPSYTLFMNLVGNTPRWGSQSTRQWCYAISNFVAAETYQANEQNTM